MIVDFVFGPGGPKKEKISNLEILKRKRFLAELYELEKKFNMSLCNDPYLGPEICVGDIEKLDVNEHGEVV